MSLFVIAVVVDDGREIDSIIHPRVSLLLLDGSKKWEGGWEATESSTTTFGSTMWRLEYKSGSVPHLVNAVTVKLLRLSLSLSLLYT